MRNRNQYSTEFKIAMVEEFKYHTKRIIFDINETQTLYRSNGKITQNYVEITYSDETIFDPLDYYLVSSTGEIFFLPGKRKR